MAKLRLTFGRRDKKGGPIVRLSGRFSDKPAGWRYVYITDCLTTVKVGRRIAPGANAVFSFAQAELAAACRGLDPTKNWYVYVEIKTDTKSTFTNAVEFPKNELGHKTVGDIKSIKAKRHKALCDQLSALDQEIKEMDKAAADAMEKSRLAARISTWLANKFSDMADEITDAMVAKAKERDALEKEKKALEKALNKYFPGLLDKSKEKNADKKKD